MLTELNENSKYSEVECNLYWVVHIWHCLCVVQDKLRLTIQTIQCLRDSVFMAIVCIWNSFSTVLLGDSSAFSHWHKEISNHIENTELLKKENTEIQSEIYLLPCDALWWFICFTHKYWVGSTPFTWGI